MTLQFGNAEVELRDITRLTTLAGPMGEQDDEPDAVYLKFERPTYTREEVLELVQILSRLRPDECGMSEDDLRLWWD